MPHDLAAVLAAYMIENARNRTPQTWLKITRTLSDCVDQHQGGVLNLRSEGWFLATFGDALAAVSCAVEIQRRLVAQDIDAEAKESPCLHIGLNFEVPPNDGEAWPPNKEDTVDRLVAMAEPGGVCLSRTIYDEIRSQIDLPFDTTRDPKHTAFVCQEIRRKLNTLNLLEAGAVRIGAAALARRAGKTTSRDTDSRNGAGVIGRIRAYIDRNLSSLR